MVHTISSRNARLHKTLGMRIELHGAAGIVPTVLCHVPKILRGKKEREKEGLY